MNSRGGNLVRICMERFNDGRNALLKEFKSIILSSRYPPIEHIFLLAGVGFSMLHIMLKTQ